MPGVLTPGSPISAFDNLQDYETVVCGRGAALPVAMDELLPKGTDAFLRDYLSAFAFSAASRKDFERALGEAAGMDVAPLITDYLDTLMN